MSCKLYHSGAQRTSNSFRPVQSERPDGLRHRRISPSCQLGRLLASIHFITSIKASLLTWRSYFERLVINDPSARLLLTTSLDTYCSPQSIAHSLLSTIYLPSLEVVIHRLPFQEVMRQRAPSTTSSEQYITPLTISRILIVRGIPPNLAGKVKGSIRFQRASLKLTS